MSFASEYRPVSGYCRQLPFGSIMQPTLIVTTAPSRHRPSGSMMQPASAVTTEPSRHRPFGSMMQPLLAVMKVGPGSSRHPPLGSRMHPSSVQIAERAPQKRAKSPAAAPPSGQEAAAAGAGLRTRTNRVRLSRNGTSGRGVGFDIAVLQSSGEPTRQAAVPGRSIGFDKTGKFRSGDHES